MMNKNFLRLSLFLFFIVNLDYAQTIVWSEDFSNGGVNWTLNNPGTTYIPGSTPNNAANPNEWIVNSNLQTFSSSIPPSSNGGDYLHITCNPVDFTCGFLMLQGRIVFAAGGSTITNRAAVLTNAIPGTTLSSANGYILRFEWIGLGHSTAFAKLIYKIGTGSWQEYSATYNNVTTWQNEAIDLSSLGWTVGQSFQFGFRWRNETQGSDPAFGVDFIRIEEKAPQQLSITTQNINPTIYCAGDNISVNFTATGAFNVGNVFTLQMSDANGSFATPTVIGTLNSTANNGTISGVIPTSTPPGTGYRFRVVSTNPAVIGSDNGQNIVINSTINPTVSITATPGNYICTGEQVTFTANPQGLGAVVPTYTWLLNGNPVGGNSPTFTSSNINNSDVVQVWMSFTGPCNSGVVNSNQIVMTVTSGSPASVEISVSPNDTVCAGSTLIFTADPINPGSNPTYQWTVNGNPVGTNSATFTTNSLNNGDVVQVTMTSSSACVLGSPTVSSNTITITFGLEASCSTTGALVGSPATINAYISGGSAPYTFTVTNFGDNTNDTQNNVNANNTTFSHVYNTPGTYNVQITITDANGCTASTTCQVTITTVNIDLPNPDFTSQPFSGCGSVTVQFTNTSTNATSYLWDFGDGNTSTDVNPTHTYTQPGSYHVTLIAYNANGSDTIFKPNTVYVYPQPVANAVANNVCVGKPTNFTDVSLHATEWFWNFGDGNTSNLQNPNHTYADTGTYTVTLNITGLGGCTDSYTFTVYVSQVPTADFSYVVTPGCQQTVVVFTNNSINSTEYLWDFGDGTFSTDTNATHEYNAPGNYNVRLVAVNGDCSSENQQIVNVTVLQSPSVDISGPSFVLTTDDVLITHNTTDADQVVIDLGDGRTLTQVPPFSDITVQYPNEGTYTVTATATKGTCTAIDTFVIKVDIAEYIFIPNAFTPNGDGMNDTWYPIIQGYDNYQVQVYDRWGVLITSMGPNDKWDGRFNGKPCPEGVYVYHITGTMKKGKKIKRMGSITLVR